MTDSKQLQASVYEAAPLGGEGSQITGSALSTSAPSAHTRGPWAVDPDLHDFDFGAPQKDGTRAQLCRYVHAPKGGGGRIAQCFANCLVTTTAELEANALLIAAAPDLLKAVRDLDDAMCANLDQRENRTALRLALIRGRAAIAKATTGRSS